MVAFWPIVGTADPLNSEAGNQAIVMLLLAILLLVGALIGAALIITALGRWSKRPAAPAAASGDLAYFRLLYERGECTQEEYERIRARLGKQLRKELKVPDPKKEGVVPPEGSPDSPAGRLPGPDSGATIERTDGPAAGGSDTSNAPA